MVNSHPCRLLCWWLFTLLGMGSGAGAAAEIRTILEPRLIDEMETVRLTLRIAGSAQVEVPDFSPLEQDFELLGTQNSSRISSINGRTSAIVEYQINLRPKRTGELQIPPLKIGDEYSEALTLAVRPLDPGVRDAIEKMIFFEAEFTDNPVYVQAQTVLIRRLFYSAGVQIYSDLPGIPELANAVVVPLGETRSDATTLNGRRYGVIEQRFAIFPENSGELTIPPISVTSSVRLQSGGRTRRSGIRVNTETMTLQVLPIPASYPASEPWLPAQSVALEAQWQPDAQSYDIGDPISVSIKAVALGNVASSIPPLAPGLSETQFKVYPEAPVLSEDSAGAQVVGHREQTFALIPTTPGGADVPTITLTWWDTIADELRRSEIPGRLIELTGQVAIAESIIDPETEDSSAATAAPSDAIQTAQEPLLTDLRRTQLLTALAVLLFLSGSWAAWRWLPRPARWQRALATHQARRERLRSLTASCRSRNLPAIRTDLSQYLTAVYECSPTQAFKRFRSLSDASELLSDLNRDLYSSSETRQEVDCDRILALAKQAGDKRSKPGAYPGELPALYS
jgi:hypothetical protein